MINPGENGKLSVKEKKTSAVKKFIVIGVNQSESHESRESTASWIGLSVVHRSRCFSAGQTCFCYFFGPTSLYSVYSILWNPTLTSTKWGRGGKLLNRGNVISGSYSINFVLTEAKNVVYFCGIFLYVRAFFSFFTGNLLYGGSLCGSFVSQGFVIGFRNTVVRETRNGLSGVSCTGDIFLCYKGLVVPGFRYTCMSLYIGYVILEDFTANTSNGSK